MHTHHIALSPRPRSVLESSLALREATVSGLTDVLSSLFMELEGAKATLDLWAQDPEIREDASLHSVVLLVQQLVRSMEQQGERVAEMMS